MKYCTKCGTQMPDDSKFCTKCGSKLNGEPVESPVKSKKPMLVGVGAVLVVAMVALVIVLSKGKGTGNPDIAASPIGKSEELADDSTDKDEQSEDLAGDVEAPADDTAEAEDDTDTVSPEAFEAYKDYARTNYGDMSFFKYSMIYLDSDDIPECVVWCGSSENVDCNVCVMSYKDGEVQAYQTEGNYYRVDFSYYEKSEVFCATKINATGGNSYFQEIVRLKDSFEKIGSTGMWTEDAGTSYNIQINGEDVSDEREIMEYINNFGCSTDITESDTFDSLDSAYASIGGAVGEKTKVSICSTSEVSNSDLEETIRLLLRAQVNECAKSPVVSDAEASHPSHLYNYCSAVMVGDYKYDYFGGLKSTHSLIKNTISFVEDATYSIDVDCEYSSIFDSDVYRFSTSNREELIGVFHVTISCTNPHSTKGTWSNDKYYLVSFDVFNGKYMVSGIAESKENEFHGVCTITDADILDKINKLVDKSSPEYIAYKAYEEYIRQKTQDGRYYVGDGVFAFVDDDEFPEYVLSTGRFFEGSKAIFHRGTILSYQSDGGVRELSMGLFMPKDTLQDGIMVDKARSGRIFAEMTSSKRSGSLVDRESIYRLFSMPDSLDEHEMDYKEVTYGVNGAGVGVFFDEDGVGTNLSGFQECYFRSLPCAFWDLVKNNYDVEFVTE